MRLEIRMPRQSEYSDEGKIARWRVSVGDVVQKGEAIADVEVDLTTTEILAQADGKIVEIWVHSGQSVPVETVIAMQSVADDAIVNEEPADEEPQEESPVENTAEEKSEDEMEFPELGDDMNSYSDQTEGPTEDKKDEAVVQYGHILASPAAVQLAEQYNVRLDNLTGTGSCGRIEREDVEAAMQTNSQFITVEDVDDLMNFDGDFSSKMPSDEPADEQVEEAVANQLEQGETALQEEKAVQSEEASMTDAEEDAEQKDAFGKQPDDETEEKAEVVADEAPEFSTEELPEEPVTETIAEQIEESSFEQTEETVDEASPAVAEELSSTEEEPVFEEEETGTSDEEPAQQQDEDDSTDPEGESSPIPGVIYMGEGPEQPIAEALEHESELPEEGIEKNIEENQEAQTTAAETADIPDVATEEAAPAEEQSPTEDAPAEPEPALVSAYQPTAEEAEAVSGFTSMATEIDEPEALAVDETDTIDSDEMIDIESAVDDVRVENDPETVRLETSTVDDVIEQTTSDGTGKSVKVRRLVARKMEQSWQNAPHFFVTVAVDMTDVIRFRTDLGVTINDFILAATTRALQEHPWVNCHFVDDEAVEQAEVNISLAVETEQGLYYPVVKNCGGRSVKELGVAAAEMVVKAHSGKLADDEMEGGSFTISNMGMLGVESFSAIITPPQVAVLAVGTVRGEVVIDEHEEMIMAPMVRLTLSADHRALDGADAADFLGTMKSYLEAPITLVASQEDN